MNLPQVSSVFSLSNYVKKSLSLIAVCSLVLMIASCSGGSYGTNSDPSSDPDLNPSQGQSWNSGNISPGAEFSFTFDDPAIIDYICTIHPEMKGSVTVEEGADSSQDTVIIDNLEFTPANITIEPGTEVTWINKDNVTHTSTSGDDNDDPDY